jgi:hypothetical protein
MLAQTYVVRIYRRNEGAGKEVAGIVEIVRSGSRRRFDSFDELHAILASRLYIRSTGRSKPRRKF